MPARSNAPTQAELESLGAFIAFGGMKRAASYLGRPAATVDRHLDDLRRLCGLHTSPQITALLISQGLVEIRLWPEGAPGSPEVFAQDGRVVVVLAPDVSARCPRALPLRDAPRTSFRSNGGPQ